jgi:hypothetical protein
VRPDVLRAVPVAVLLDAFLAAVVDFWAAFLAAVVDFLAAFLAAAVDFAAFVTVFLIVFFAPVADFRTLVKLFLADFSTGVADFFAGATDFFASARDLLAVFLMLFAFLAAAFRRSPAFSSTRSALFEPPMAVAAPRRLCLNFDPAVVAADSIELTASPTISAALSSFPGTEFDSSSLCLRVHGSLESRKYPQPMALCHRLP